MNFLASMCDIPNTMKLKFHGTQIYINIIKCALFSVNTGMIWKNIFVSYSLLGGKKLSLGPPY